MEDLHRFHPSEATGHIVCANCHLASKPGGILRFHKLNETVFSVFEFLL